MPDGEKVSDNTILIPGHVNDVEDTYTMSPGSRGAAYLTKYGWV